MITCYPSNNLRDVGHNTPPPAAPVAPAMPRAPAPGMLRVVNIPSCSCSWATPSRMGAGITGRPSRSSMLSHTVTNGPVERVIRPWQGANRGPHIITAIVLFFVATSPVAFYEIGYASALAIAFYVLATSAVANLWTCRSVDPGAIDPKEEQDDVVAALWRGECVLPQKYHGYTKDYTGQFCRADAALGSVPRPLHVQGVHARYCATCHIWRPVGTSHCSLCGYCMRRFDHHCGVIGACVALHNHRFFASFLVSAGLGAMTYAAGCGINLARTGWPTAQDSWNAIGITSIVLCAIGVYASTVIFFGCAHCYLTIAGSTTKAHLTSNTRNLSKSISWLTRLFELWCAPIRPKTSVPPPNLSPEPTMPRATTAYAYVPPPAEVPADSPV